MLAVDSFLLAAWAGSIAIAWARSGRRSLPNLALGLGILLLIVGPAMWLEAETGGRLVHPGMGTVPGILAVLAGTTLHAAARIALGRHWASLTTPSTDLVTTGPYARRRHPAYAGLGIMAVGTVLAHPSIAVMAGMSGLGVGLFLKARREDEALENAFGDRWRAWADEVPAWVRRPSGSVDGRR